MKKIDGLDPARVDRYAPRPGRCSLSPPLNQQARVAPKFKMLAWEGWDEHIAGYNNGRLPGVYDYE